MFEDADNSTLLDAMRDAQRDERAATARRLLAVGHYARRRLAEAGDEHGDWCVDDWEAIAAEVAAELGISRGRASSQMHHGTTLIERLPGLAAVFAAGDVDFRVITAAVSRTSLLTDKTLLAEIDAELAARAPQWNRLSREKIAQLVDWMVVARDPDAVRLSRQSDLDRHIDVDPQQNGMADVWGSVRAPDAAAFDRRLDELAATVCGDDPRTTAQRRADALAALAAGAATMACACGRGDCPTASEVPAEPSRVVIHVLAEAATIDGGDKPGFLPGYGTVPAETVRNLARRAELRPVQHPGSRQAEARYRPSTALAEFIRCRDLTCRFPGCDCPAEYADIDHTVPYPHGPTHPSNLKLLCRVHHLLKTFYREWNDRQLADGTVVWTAPSGREYTTTPGGGLFFPRLTAPTGTLTLPTDRPPENPGRGLSMPTRRRARAADRAYRVEWERGVNRTRHGADPPPF